MGRCHRKGRRVHGILLYDKPAGFSSNRAMQDIKRLFGAQKAGHTGSLDPLATGMLPICFGEATKLGAFLLDADKGYETTLTLGVTTDSADADGAVLQRRPVPAGLDRPAFEAAAARFTGAQMQTPPVVSAIKVDGVRSYRLAREGRAMQLAPRPVAIHSLEVLDFDGVAARLSVRCSKGTYIRSLVSDLGEALGCGAHVTALRRTFVSPFDGDAGHRMWTRQALEARLASAGNADPSLTSAADPLAEDGQPPASCLDTCLLPLDAGLQYLPAAEIDEGSLQGFGRGQPVMPLRWIKPPAPPAPSGPPADSVVPAKATESAGRVPDVLPVRVYGPDQRLLGLARPDEGGRSLHPSRVIQW